MNLPATDTLLASQPGQNDSVIGCATCWAAKYCAFFSLEGPQPPPPPACPLLPKPASRRALRRPRLGQN